MLVHKSTYLDVPKSWLGEQFYLEAKYLKKLHINQYNHEYLGEVTGTGGEIFDNLEVVKLSDEEVKSFDNIKCGVDFGFAADPFVYVVCFYHNNKLFIFDEIYATVPSRKASMICECSVCVSAVQGKVRTVSSTVSDFCRVLKKS